MAATIQELIADFGLLDDWEDRYRYVIELGRTLPPLAAAEHNEHNKVRGCASQVWFVAEPKRNGETTLTFRGDSDALIVRGLIAIVFALYSGKPAGEIASLDPEPVFESMGLRDHLTAQRSNGLSSMVSRIRAEARGALGEPQVISGR